MWARAPDVGPCHRLIQVHEEAKSGSEKLEIVELDNVKDEADVVKSDGPWKDHWIIQ